MPAAIQIAAGGKEHDNRGRGRLEGRPGALVNGALRAYHQERRAVHDQHGEAQQPREQPERVQQREERAGVVDLHRGIEVKGHAEEQVAEGDAEHDGRHRAPDKEPPVPGIAPARIGHLAPIVDPDRPEEEGEQREYQGGVEARESRRVDERPRGEGRARGRDEPHLVALPGRADRVDHDPPLLVGAPDERQQRAYPQVPAVGQGEADEQHPDEQPPDDLERFVVEDHAGAPFS